MRKVAVFGILLAMVMCATLFVANEPEAGKIGKKYQTVLTADLSGSASSETYVSTNAYRGEMYSSIYFRIYTTGVSGGATTIGFYPAFADTQYADSIPLPTARPNGDGFTDGVLTLKQASDSLSVLIGGYGSITSGTGVINYPPYIIIKVTETETAGYLKIDMFALKEK
jgi:hypothetical protein